MSGRSRTPDPRHAASVLAVLVVLAFADGLFAHRDWALAVVQSACALLGAGCVYVVVRSLRRRRGHQHEA